MNMSLFNFLISSTFLSPIVSFPIWEPVCIAGLAFCAIGFVLRCFGR